MASRGDTVVVQVKVFETRQEEQVKLCDIVVGKVELVEVEIYEFFINCLQPISCEIELLQKDKFLQIS